MKNKEGHIRTFSRKIVGWFHHILHLRHILYHGIYKRQNHLAYLETHHDIAARDIIDYLSSPIPFCRFCTTDVTPYRWTTSKREREEWLEWFHLDGAITSVYNQL